MHHYPDSSYEAHNRSEQRSVFYRGHAPEQYSPTGPGYGGSAQNGMSREMRETSFVNGGYRRKPQSIQSIDQHPNDRWDHSYHRGNPQEIELPDMGNPSFRRPYVGSPSSYKKDRTQERTRSREMMERAYVNEGFVHTPPSLQTNDQYPMNRFDHSYHRGSLQAIEQPGMANPSNYRILVMPPSSPTMDGAREGTSNKQRNVKRESIRIILTRVCSAVFIIADCVFDWMQYTDMTTPPEFFAEIGSNFLRSPKTDKHCTSKDEVAEKYMYFTIAGTVLTVIQLANIIFQIYSEVKYMKEKTEEGDDNDSNQKKPMDKIMKYPKKILDGRTETLYSVLFVEIPQGLLLLRYQNVCLPSCAKTLKSKTVTRRIRNIVNGGIAILNNAFRYLTCTQIVEETVEDDTCCGGGGKCVGFLRCLFKCACPCLCCFHRYEFLVPCCICGQKCVCDMCNCYSEPWFCKIPFCGLCTFHYCPLLDPENPKGGQKCCDVTSECCKCSDDSNLFDYEPLVFNTILAAVANAIYVVLYFLNICSVLCLLLDYDFILEPLKWIMTDLTNNIFGI